MHPMQSIAVRAARAAGNVLMRRFDQRDTLRVDTRTGEYSERVSG